MLANLRHAALLTLVLGLTSAPALAIAQAVAASCDDYVAPEGREDSAALTLRGVACFEAHDYGRALGYYRRAYAIDRSPLLEAAIGRTMHELGLWSTARSYYERFLRSQQAQTDAENRQRIQERLDTLKKELVAQGGLVSLRAAPTQTAAYLELPNGHRESLGNTPMALRLAPGSHTLVFERRGYYPSTQRIRVREGQTQVIEAELVSQDAPFNVTGRQLKRAGAITAGVSAPLLAAGLTLRLMGGDRLDRADDEPQADDAMRLRDRGTSMRDWGANLLAIGGVTLLVGGALIAAGYMQDVPSEQDKAAPKPKRVSWTPLVSPTGVGVSVQW